MKHFNKYLLTSLITALFVISCSSNESALNNEISERGYNDSSRLVSTDWLENDWCKRGL